MLVNSVALFLFFCYFNNWLGFFQFCISTRLQYIMNTFILGGGYKSTYCILVLGISSFPAPSLDPLPSSKRLLSISYFLLLFCSSHYLYFGFLKYRSHYIILFPKIPMSKSLQHQSFGIQHLFFSTRRDSWFLSPIPDQYSL